MCVRVLAKLGVDGEGDDVDIDGGGDGDDEWCVGCGGAVCDAGCCVEEIAADDGWFCWLKCCCVDEVRVIEDVVTESSIRGQAIEWVWFGAW